ncbi:hypothetical protein ATG66_0114 [Vibrio sp. ES.051]|uniref:hypothetical protein n=1 Tax=Vibrio sp. ES.051 TaxID=1761909 RepID=UPI000BF9AC06|nr:hypothetical protein [Vibrio sp. ES.051]PFG58805.1 hypothetical protein ATG66_0114 [Vibrio sp. ES.051]
MKKTLVSVLIASATIAGCGGGGSSEPSQPSNSTLLSGRAIDGYIVGATVHYDFNSNGVVDPDEPSAITEAGGVFTIEGDITEEQQACFEFVPVIVDVPVGAIDEDLGEVTQAYVLNLPPAFTLPEEIANGSVNITPLTTMLWESAKQTVEREQGEAYSCELVKDNEQVRNAIKDAMRNVAGDLVWHFNISEEELWSDYIADGNSAVYDIAEQLMASIQLSFEETYELSLKYPYAHINVAHYLNDPTDWQRQDGEQLWYKSISIRQGSFWSESVYAVDDNWLPERLIRNYLQEDSVTDFGTVGYVNEYRNMSSDPSFDDYICSKSETLLSKVADTDNQYGMDNKSSFYDLSELECNEVSLTDTADSQNMTLSTARVSGVYDEEGSRYKWNTVPSEYAHWLGFSTDVESIDIDALNADIAALPQTYGTQDSVGADWWEHTKRYKEGENNVSEHRTNTAAEMPNGDMVLHHRFISYPNGTFKYECDRGDGWYDCTK